jgi:cystathionine beta-lyase/cystathionine gamma-synthase
LAAAENAEAALVTASGMAAIATTMIAVACAGDHLMVQNSLYGGTHDLMTEEMPRLGIEVDFIDAGAPDSWRASLHPKTRAIYVETMTNPLMQVADLRAVVEFARAHDLISIVDNTFASPLNFRPAEFGFDLSIHSGTKYLNGHTDIVAGAIIGRRS